MNSAPTGKARAWQRQLHLQGCYECQAPVDKVHHIAGSKAKHRSDDVGEFLVMPLCGACHAQLHRETRDYQYEKNAFLKLVLRELELGETPETMAEQYGLDLHMFAACMDWTRTG